MSQDRNVSEDILVFIQKNFLDGDPRGELTLDSPLLEWGILTSLNTATLLGYIRGELGIAVPAIRVTGRDFHSVRTIARLVDEVGAGSTV
ncbi:phosphopantetheine-binding protein [Frankia sp. AgB32]|uniref:phosphopantetheine-binding protein n=1 Tax=Frankia sp. AgB32 TaxID=631119 RepID=UPI00200DE129|nr:acyl carrier protein [Frankia sp. AgB32]MCK9897082.1 phosphopantetheine-binding protein [Frankia sp. AgB32]